MNLQTKVEQLERQISPEEGCPECSCYGSSPKPETDLHDLHVVSTKTLDWKCYRCGQTHQLIMQHVSKRRDEVTA